MPQSCGIKSSSFEVNNKEHIHRTMDVLLSLFERNEARAVISVFVNDFIPHVSRADPKISVSVQSPVNDHGL